jgi:hypothetical protein
MKTRRPICFAMLLFLASAGLAVCAEPDVHPPHVSTDASIQYDYDIVYVRVPRPYPAEYNHINHLNQAGLHQTNAPGAELRVLHPDGRDESLVAVEERESITDPVVSFDGQWVYFAKFHHMAMGEAHMSKLRSRAGADIYKIHVPTRKVVRLTKQEPTPTAYAGAKSHPRGVHNLAPCPVAGDRVVFVSDRNGYRGVREQTQPALQLFVMDDDGSNVELIGAMNLGTALHPVALRDGRVMFSSLETQGLRSDERWGIWAIHPDGTGWGPLTSALGSPPGQAIHFQAQLSDESIVVESYYQTGSTDGFGTFWKFPLRTPEGQPAFGPGAQRFAPFGLEELTLFSSFQDVRPNRGVGNVSNRIVMGNVTHPSAAPDQHLLTVWALPRDAQDTKHTVYDAGIYLIKSGQPVDHPKKMRAIKNDSRFQELWPRALVPYRRIYGVDEPKRLVHRNDGTASPQLPEGTPFGLVGTSSLYKRESYPGGVVPPGRVTAVSTRPDDRKRQWRELSVSRFSFPGNWGEQGADAGLYENSDIWGVRILVLEPVSDPVFAGRHHFALGSRSEERIRILGEFPVRKFEGDNQPVDPDGNPDTSFLVKIPADVAWTFQTLDDRGMALNMAQTWHQVRPGEIRNDCGGCHAHSQKPTDFRQTAAAEPGYVVRDLATATPLFTKKAAGSEARKWDTANETGVRIVSEGVHNVEYFRDVKPILDRSCVACHTVDRSRPGGPLLDEHQLAFDDYRPIERDWRVPWAENVKLPRRSKLPTTYARLAQYSWAFQSRRSPWIWKLWGRRLDGFHNDDVHSPPLDYHDERDVLDWCHRGQNKRRDVDYTGSVMPPPAAVAGKYRAPGGELIKVAPLTDEDRFTLARWVDIGCPIDIGEDAENRDGRGLGWMLDEGRPTLTLTYPPAGVGAEPLKRILVGMHDYYSGLHMASFTVTADFAIDGVPPGENLAPRFRSLPGNRWEMKLTTPITTLEKGTLKVSIQDREGNVGRIERSFVVRTRVGARAPIPDRHVAVSVVRPVPVLIDTDIGTGIDDAFALGLALGSEEVDVRAGT